MNTKYTVKFSAGKGNLYQGIYHPFVSARNLEDLVKLGRNSVSLHSSLKRFTELISTEYNIYDMLILKGFTDVNPLLKHKKLNINKLLNSIPYQKMLNFTTFLTDIVLKDERFVEFSRGFVDSLCDDFKTSFERDYSMFRMAINATWSVEIAMELNEGNPQNPRSSYLSVSRTDYMPTLETEMDKMPEFLGQCLNRYISPFTPIFAQKTVKDAFGSLNSYASCTHNIHYNLERLAWELYEPSGAPRHLEAGMLYSQFNEMTRMFMMEFNYLPSVPSFGRSITVSVSTDDRPKFDYCKFDTYANSHHQQWLCREKKSTEQPLLLTVPEIENLLMRITRYYEIVKVGGTMVDDFLSRKETFTDFDKVMETLEATFSKYIDTVCQYYLTETEPVE
jgi:hypothetical protein